MELNPDCVRQIMFGFENLLDGTRPQHISSGASLKEWINDPKLNKFTDEEALYNFKQCGSSDFFIGYKQYMRSGFSIKDLSPKGHEFISNIRDDTAWDKIKKIAREGKTQSLSSFVTIATQIAISAAKGYLNLP